MTVVNFAEKFELFSDHWSPKVIAEMNDYQFKLVKIEGEFVWHDHGHTDEVNNDLEGSMNIEFEDRTITLDAGEMHVVPKGTRHRPFAESECKVMLVEPRGVINTGKAEGDLKADNDVWI